MPLLPRIGNVGVLRGIHNASGHISLLSCTDNVESQSAEVNLRGIGVIQCVVHEIAGHILASAARETIYEGKVALFGTLGTDGEVTLGSVGHIIFRIVGRLVILVGIDAEYGEVARVAGPHPVVGVAAELTDPTRHITQLNLWAILLGLQHRHRGQIAIREVKLNRLRTVVTIIIHRLSIVADVANRDGIGQQIGIMA